MYETKKRKQKSSTAEPSLINEENTLPCYGFANMSSRSDKGQQHSPHKSHKPPKTYETKKRKRNSSTAEPSLINEDSRTPSTSTTSTAEPSLINEDSRTPSTSTTVYDDIQCDCSTCNSTTSQENREPSSNINVDANAYCRAYDDATLFECCCVCGYEGALREMKDITSNDYDMSGIKSCYDEVVNDENSSAFVEDIKLNLPNGLLPDTSLVCTHCSKFLNSSRKKTACTGNNTHY